MNVFQKVENGRMCLSSKKVYELNEPGELRALTLQYWKPDLSTVKEFIQFWETTTKNQLGWTSKSYPYVLYVGAINKKPLVVLLSENGQVSQEIMTQAYKAISDYGLTLPTALEVVPQQGQCNFKK